ncbi:MAG: TonB-dependent receptor [Sphingomonadaceae bacterium]|uniref:TonB-dependent receptor domain-containing protein n=1 Tax=Thermaurantiacus sp. TaxID=2820283 RepID=UPI00298EFB14|nr:TonB-dependent receptor [Thermaurantiacus sp.]MCS6987381.1 TonB-dependent receptor [Sphingomonadaceae bacterium]MDW8415301.1 TonB-dependent receptor [Thermaurantiacus sp.]
MTSFSRAALRGGVATLAVSFGLLAGGGAWAQGQTAAATTDEPGTIVVTGTLIRDPNLIAATPVNVVGEQEIQLRQFDSAEQLLREIPGVVPSIGAQVNNGNGGAAFLNLRGLGSNRNIVLLDGVRLSPSGLNGVFDVNNIPLALVQRADVLTGGASTTYGADAVSGVVNFITKRDFTGIDVTSNLGITEQGDGRRFRTDLVVGTGTGDGRGNVVLGIGYIDVQPVYQGDRDFGFTAYSTLGGFASGSGTSVPSRFTLVNPTAGNLITVGCGGPGQPACFNPQAGARQVTADGTAFRTTAAFDPFNFNPFNVYQVPFERINIYAAGRYEVADDIEVYGRGLYSNNVISTIIAPSGAFALSNVTVPLNNPFLTPAQRNAFCAFDLDPTINYRPRFTPDECARAANPRLRPGDADYREVRGVTLWRRAVEFGPRISEYTTDFYDLLFGARGGLVEGVTWDVSGSYGRSRNLSKIKGYYLNSRVRQSMLAGRDAAGNPVCFDPSNDCVPVNWFGPAGSITPEMNDFLNEQSFVENTADLIQGRGLLQGDTGIASPLAERNANFALGAEFRGYRATRTSDTLASSGDLGGAGGAEPNVDGGYSVWEIYGELQVPLITGRSFFEELTVGGGVRYSKYSVDAAGNPTFDTLTWKAEGSWAPFEGLRLRGVYGKASRAPNITEFFFPQNVELTNLSDDPCANLRDDGTPIPGRPVPTGVLRDVCIAQGAPPSAIGFIPQPTVGQINAVFGGNPLLKPEDSTSWTVGAVFTPKFVRNFSATVDYYNIRVTNAITNPTPGDRIAACFAPDKLSVTNPDCVGPTGISRDPATGSLSGDPNVVRGLFMALTNQGRLETSGIDFTANWSTPIGEDWNFAVSVVGNYTFTNKFQATPTSVNRECLGFFSTNCGSLQPEFSIYNRFTLSWQRVDVSLLHRFFTGFIQEPLDAARAPYFEGRLTGGNLAGREVNFREMPDQHYLDLSVGFNVTENINVSFLVQNLLNADPPIVGQEAGPTAFNSGNTYPSTYDPLGRRYAATLRLRF